MSRREQLFLVLGGFFLTNALLAELVGAKIFSLEKALGFQPLNLNVLGTPGLGFNLTAGVLLWPVVFLVTDLVNEYFGTRGVRRLSFAAAGLIVYAFAMLQLALEVPGADFWATSAQGYDRDRAFASTFRQGQFIILGSLVAFLVGQLLDASVFQWLKRRSGGRRLWLRATGSTLVSQFVDSFVVLFIAFYLGSDWPLLQVLAVGSINYAYKFAMAVALTPAVYGLHALIDRYLGASGGASGSGGSSSYSTTSAAEA